MKSIVFQAAWSLKLSCLTEEFYIDELENDERGVVEIFLDDTVLASKARPGTSLSRPISSSQTSKQAIRFFVYRFSYTSCWKLKVYEVYDVSGK